LASIRGEKMLHDQGHRRKGGPAIYIKSAMGTGTKRGEWKHMGGKKKYPELDIGKVREKKGSRKRSGED